MSTSGYLLPCISITINCSSTSWDLRRWVLDELVVAWNIVATQILPLPASTVFVAISHPFGFIVTCFIGCFMVPGGQLSHPVGQILKVLSILVCGIPTSTTTGIVSFPLTTFFWDYSLHKYGSLSGCLVQKMFSPYGWFCPQYICIQDIFASYFCCFFRPLLLWHPLAYDTWLKEPIIEYLVQ